MGKEVAKKVYLVALVLFVCAVIGGVVGRIALLGLCLFYVRLGRQCEKATASDVADLDMMATRATGFLLHDFDDDAKE